AALGARRDLLRGINLQGLRMFFRGVEGRASCDVTFWRPVGDFLLYGLLAIAGVRMVAEELRTFAALARQLLEEVRQRLRVIARLVHDDGAHGVGLRFIGARVVQDHTLRPELDSRL